MVWLFSQKYGSKLFSWLSLLVSDVSVGKPRNHEKTEWKDKATESSDEIILECKCIPTE